VVAQTMFSSLRQSKRCTSPKSVETPRIVPSIQLTTATPTHTSLAPGGEGVGTRRVGPKRTLVLHEAPSPPPLPPRLVIPMCENGAPQRPPSRATSHFGSSKLRIFMDSASSNDEMPKLVKKKKSRVALDSIKVTARTAQRNCKRTIGRQSPAPALIPKRSARKRSGL
jgi:hypothetical protein